MTLTDEDRFPPLRANTATDETPLDLSVLARVSTPETETPQEPKPPPKRDTPPRSRARKGPQSGKPTADKPPPTPRTVTRDDVEETPTYRPGILVKPLRDLYVTVGTLVLPFNQPVGTAFIQNAEACAKSLDNAAKTDKQIRRVLMLLITGSVWGEVIIAHMPIMMALSVTLVPSIRKDLGRVQSDGNAPNETINPVSNGYAPGR